MTIGGVRSPYAEAGAASEEAAEYVHGNPDEGLRDLVARVGAFGRAVAADMPGFGRADKPADFEHTVAGYARHLDGALRELGVRRAHLVLHDFGGPWGLQWASDHTDQVASLTLINIGVLPGYHWHFFARVWRTPLLGDVFMATANRRMFRTSLRRGNAKLPAAFIDGMFDDFDRGTRRAVLKLYRATPQPGADAERYASVLRPLDLPALVVWGKTDPYIGVEYAERQREVFPRARVVILEESGHWPHADDPEGVAAAVVPFLREQMVRA